MSDGASTLLVMAAGMGSRFGGLKQMEPVGPAGETLLDYSVYDARRAGFGRVVFVIRQDFADEFRARVGERAAKQLAVDYVYQELAVLPAGFDVPPGRTKPWGTGHAVWCARDAVREPFVVINGDDFYGREAFFRMARHLMAPAVGATSFIAPFAMAGYALGETLSSFGTVSRGVCELDADGRLRGIREVAQIERTPEGAGRIVGAEGQGALLAAATIVSMNFWGLTPAVFPLIEERFLEFLAAAGREQKSEFYLPAVIEHAIQTQQATVDVLPSGNQWFGVTYREDLPRVREALQHLIAAGVYPAAIE